MSQEPDNNTKKKKNKNENKIRNVNKKCRFLWFIVSLLSLRRAAGSEVTEGNRALRESAAYVVRHERGTE